MLLHREINVDELQTILCLHHGFEKIYYLCTILPQRWPLHGDRYVMTMNASCAINTSLLNNKSIETTLSC